MRVTNGHCACYLAFRSIRHEIRTQLTGDLMHCIPFGVSNDTMTAGADQLSLTDYMAIAICDRI